MPWLGMLYSQCYLLSQKNISQIKKTDQSVVFRNTRNCFWGKSFKLQALGYQSLLAHTIPQLTNTLFFFINGRTNLNLESGIDIYIVLNDKGAMGL